MLFWKRKKKPKIEKPKIEQPKERPFYCRAFENLICGDVFECVGRTLVKEYATGFEPNARDINTGEKVRINPAWLCVIRLKEK